MTTQSVPVLVTRPQAEAEAFAAALTARFGSRVRPVVAPLIAPRIIRPDIPGHGYCAVVFTSAQAVEAARQLGLDLPTLAWCVGERTARAASAAGFDARSADGDAEALLKLLAASPPEGSILYLRGVDTAYNLLKNLRSLGIIADEAIVYRQEPLALMREALALLQQPVDVLVPLFSPRTARLFCAALPVPIHASLHLAAISANVAGALGDLPRASLAVAHHPDAPAMLDAVETLLVGLPPP